MGHALMESRQGLAVAFLLDLIACNPVRMPKCLAAGTRLRADGVPLLQKSQPPPLNQAAGTPHAP